MALIVGKQIVIADRHLRDHIREHLRYIRTEMRQQGLSVPLVWQH